MNRRRITRQLGAAAGGLGAAFLPVAVAFADDYSIVPDPAVPGTITGIYGLIPAAPAETESVQTHQELFNFTDLTNGETGSFGADASTSTDPFGDTSELAYVTSAGGADAPPVGSVFQTYTLGFDPEFKDIYSAIPSSGGDEDLETLVTPFGNISIPFPLFDAATVAGSDVGDSAFADDFGIFPDANIPETITAVTGAPPADFVTQGTQTFETAAGTPFDADTTTTSDIFGNTTEALLVTGYPGTDTAAGDVPPVGSVYNVLNLFGDSGLKDIYSAIPSTTGGADVVSDTLVTPFGNIPIPDTLDAAAVTGDDAAPVPLAGGYDIVPGSSETLTGINGVPPLDAAIQGTQFFDVDNSAGSVGTFGADVSTTTDPFGDIDEALRVTSDASGTGTVGTAAGDIPPVGSVFYIDSLTDLGVKNIYADLPSTTGGPDVFSDTLVTPFGDFSIPVSDALAGLGAADSFLDPLLTSLTSLF